MSASLQSGSQPLWGDTLRHRKQRQTPKSEAPNGVPYVCGINLLSHPGIRVYRHPITERWLWSSKDLWVWCPLSPRRDAVAPSPWGMCWSCKTSSALVKGMSGIWLVFIEMTCRLQAHPEEFQPAVPVRASHTYFHCTSNQYQRVFWSFVMLG